jgi:DNA polymerase (family 10)
VSDDTRIPLGRAHLLAQSAIREAAKAGLETDSMTAVGSIRRFAPEVGDVSLLAVTPSDRHEDVLNGFVRLPFVSRMIARTRSMATVRTERSELTLHVAATEDAGAALVWHTGSRKHVEQLRQRAESRDLRFSGGCLLRPTGEPVRTPTERDLYSQLGLPYIAPELREGADEIDAADRRVLPDLVSEVNIRGDLHMHSTWSDGRDGIERMLLEGERLGYEYIAITDHSQSSAASLTLFVDDVRRQREEVESLRQQRSRTHILHGIEVEILHDGGLDFEDDLLERFDIVLASLHDSGGHDAARLTERYLRAIAHPLVNVITHPANRVPGRSSGYDLDFNRLFTAAVASGTAMEIDGSPGHLDLDGSLARRAAAAGVLLTINSDAHRADLLARQMLNGRSLAGVRAFVAQKRRAARTS